MTGGGVYGVVKHIDLEKNIVEIEIAHGVIIRVDKAYVYNDVFFSAGCKKSKWE